MLPVHSAVLGSASEFFRTALLRWAPDPAELTHSALATQLTAHLTLTHEGEGREGAWGKPAFNVKVLEGHMPGWCCRYIFHVLLCMFVSGITRTSHYYVALLRQSSILYLCSSPRLLSRCDKNL